MFGNNNSQYEGPFRKQEDSSFQPNYLANERRVYASRFGPDTVVEVDWFGRVQRVEKKWFPRS